MRRLFSQESDEEDVQKEKTQDSQKYVCVWCLSYFLLDVDIVWYTGAVL